MKPNQPIYPPETPKVNPTTDQIAKLELEISKLKTLIVDLQAKSPKDGLPGPPGKDGSNGKDGKDGANADPKAIEALVENQKVLAAAYSSSQAKVKQLEMELAALKTRQFTAQLLDANNNVIETTTFSADKPLKLRLVPLEKK